MSPQMESAMEVSGQTTQMESAMEVSGQTTQMESAMEVSGQTTQTESALEVSGQTTQTESALEVSGQTAQIESAMEVSNQTDVKSEEKPQLIYRCKKCRRIVASQEQIVSHERGQGKDSFKWKKRAGDTENGQPECTSIFVEPMKWMQPVEEGYVAQKLQCLGCNYRLGFFNWAGMQCNCGAWVIPAFQLHSSRLDECRM